MRPPESWNTARATLAITLATAAAWVIVELGGLFGWAIGNLGFLPLRIGLENDPFSVPVWLTPLTATLVHAGFFHLLFNILMMVVCGRAVEGVLGPGSLVLLYLIGAYVAAAGRYLADPASIVPMVDSSGAVSAVIGAYAMLFGRNKVRVADPRLALLLHALWLMAGWVGLQLLVGYVTGAYGLGIAIFAHIGAFIAGVLLARPLLLFRYRKA